MPDVVSVTLEANISGKTTAAFARFDRLTKGIGKSVLSFRKHTDSLVTSTNRLHTGLSKKGSFASFDRRVESSTKKVRVLGKEITSLRTRLDSLGKAFSGFAKNSGASFSAANTGMQQTRRNALQVARAYNAAGRAVSNMRAQAGRSPRGIRMPNVIYNGGGGGGGNRGGNAHHMGGDIPATRWLQAGGSMFILGQGISNVGKSILKTGAGLFGAGKEFEKALASLSSRLSAEQKYMMPSFVKESASQGREVGKLPSEIAGAFEEMAAMGIEIKDIIGTGGKAVNVFGAAGNLTTELAAKGLGQILSALVPRNAQGNVDFAKAGNLSDILVGVGQATQANESDMIRAFEYAAGSFAASNIGYKTGALLIGAQSDIGRKATKGGRDVAEYVSRISSRSEVLQQKLGVNVSYKTNADGQKELDVIGVTEQIKRALDARKDSDPLGTANLEREIFGEQGQKAYLGISSGLNKIKELQEKVFSKDPSKNFDGKAYNKMLEATGTLSHDLIRAKGAVEAFGNSLLKTNRGPIKSLVGGFTTLMGKLTTFVEKHPRITQAFLAIGIAGGTAAIGIGAALSALGTMGFAIGGLQGIGGILASFVGGTKLLGKFGILSRSFVKLRGSILGTRVSMASLTPFLARIGSGFSAIRVAALALASTPVGLALAAAGLLIWKFWKPLKVFFGGFMEGVMSQWGPAIEGLVSSVGSLWAAFKPGRDLMAKVFSSVFGMVDITKDGVNELSGLGKDLGNTVGAQLGNKIRQITNLIEDVSGALALVQNRLYNIGKWFSDKHEFVIGIQDDIKQLITDFLNPLESLEKMLFGEKPAEKSNPMPSEVGGFMPGLDALFSPLKYLEESLFGNKEKDMAGASSGSLNVDKDKPVAGAVVKPLIPLNLEELRGLNRKMVAGGAFSQDPRSLGEVNNVALQKMSDSGLFTSRDLLALKTQNDQLPLYAQSKITEEENPTLYRAMQTTESGYMAGQITLNSTPTIIINGADKPEAIQSNVEAGIVNASREMLRDYRGNYALSGSF